jgi:predicted protein tyrosine phosphatase
MIKSVQFMDISSAELFQPQDDFCISILSPGRRVDLKKWRKSRVLSLRFDDIEELVLNGDGNGENSAKTISTESPKNVKLFNIKMAQKVVNFVEQIATSRRENNLIIHCEAGRSRSAAIAKYACEKYGFPFPEGYDYHNVLVYNVLKNLK